MADLMTIGEFATATWLSPKALRLYDQKGLLSPEAVDPFNGYRRYSPAQVETARLITLLRRIDMSLEQIAKLLELSPKEQGAQIARHRERDTEQYARRNSLAAFLEQAVGHGSLDRENQPDVSRFEVAIRRAPESPMLTATQRTSARELPEIIQTSANKLFALAEHRGGAVGDLIVIYHGQVGWESDGPIEVCVPINEHDRAHRVEPEQTELFTHVLAEDVHFPRILAAFEATRARAAQLEFIPTAPPREVYRSIDHGPIPRCEVALPIIATES